MPSPRLWQVDTPLQEPNVLLIPMNVVICRVQLMIHSFYFILWSINADLENITDLIDSTTTNSTSVTINCYNLTTHNTTVLKLTLMQNGNKISQITTHCNTTEHFNNLQSGTNYSIMLNREFYGSISCELNYRQFETITDKIEKGTFFCSCTVFTWYS